MKHYWVGTPPEKCDICLRKIDEVFYDAATFMGSWANMCPMCYGIYGPGRLGMGFGQEYTKQQDGRWLKTGG